MDYKDIKLENGLSLEMTEDGLTLTDGNLSLCGDFAGLKRRLNQSNLTSEMLVKAAKIKNIDHEITVLDATAGMGEDSFLLAAAGFKVELYEKDEVIALLLEDALRRAGEDEELSEIASRMSLHKEDSIESMRNLSNPVDVIYLDPMFPERQKSGLIKKKFQLLQKLERPCMDGDKMLEAALAAGAKRIVIKRPLKGPFLAEKKPSYSLKGKAIRYDVIIG